jgi:Protein of unknown function (DUF1549)/Protein of unknown function (DUF1553)
MLRASVRKTLPGRRPFLVLGVLVLGGFFTFLAPGSAQNTKIQPKGTVDPKSKADAPSTKTIKLELHKGSAPDVAEAVRIINEKLAKGWEANKVTPSRQATDAEFLRRATLDIVGRIAKIPEIEQFYKDPESTRRSLLIDRLLADEDYARHWANMWANWLLGRSGAFGRGMYHEQMNVWLEDQFAQNKGYDKIVTALLTAKGKNTDNGAVNFILAHLGEEVRNTPQDKERVGREGHFEMVPITSRLTRLFLGTQVQCAQCHDHPFLGNVKQNQFWGINAFLRQVKRGGAPAMMNMRNMTSPPLELDDDTNVNTRPLAYYEKRNGVILRQRAEFLPAGPGKEPTELDEDKQGLDRRKYLAEYLIAHDNFPRAIVNRMWATFFGKGFVNPIDDFNDQNQPSNPELLNELAVQIKHYNYDMKKLIRWICNSDAYNLSCAANATNEAQEKETLFSRVLLKSMTPEQLFESLMLATNSEVAESKQGKKDLKDKWLESLIANFGDDEGNEVNFNGTVVQALMMMNGKEINDAITRKDKGTVDLAIKSSRSAEEAVTKLFLAALNRKPTKREIMLVMEDMSLQHNPPQQRKDNEKGNLNNRYYDLFWALLNCNEFLLNH